MGARRWQTALWLAASLCASTAAWLMLARGGGRVHAPRLRVVLVDASASVARTREWLGWVRGELRAAALAARTAREELAVVSFAQGVATGFAPGDPALFLAALEGRSGPPFDPRAGLADGATRLAAALGLVEPFLCDPARPPGLLVVLGPPSYTGSSPAALLARLSACGVTIEPRPPPRAVRSDLGLLELTCAARVEEGAPLVALGRFVFHRGTARAGPATLALELENGGVTRTLAHALPLPIVDGEFELPLDCGPAGAGRTELRAHCQLAPGPDLLPENDSARTSTLAGAAREVGVAVGTELEAAARAWLGPPADWPEGLEFRWLAPSECGPALAELDALVTFDVALDELPAPLLDRFVRRGGGWLVLSGWRFLGDWVPGATDGVLHRLLPCEPAQDATPPRDVVLLVDGSGSMEGEPFASVRAAALELVGAARPSDRVSLRFFTTQLGPEHVLKERTATRAEDAEAARRAARDLLALRVPAGATYLLRSLREFRTTLSEDETGEIETLALLLTDGREREALSDPPGAARAVAAELAGARARLVVIGVGEVEHALLATLAGGAENLRSARTPEELRTQLKRELRRGQLVEGELELHHAERSSGSLADEVASAAAGSPRLPPLERRVQNRLRPGAESIWESVEREPVLALARAGLGRTALFASCPLEGWALRYQGEPSAFAACLRWLARGPARGPLPRARIEGRRLVVSGLAPATAPVLRAQLVDSSGALPPEELILVAAERDPFGTRAAEVAGEGHVAPLLVLAPTGAAPADGELALTIEQALPDELAWRELSVPHAWLAPAPVAPRHARPALARRAGPFVLALALGLLLAAGLSATRGQAVQAFRR